MCPTAVFSASHTPSVVPRAGLLWGRLSQRHFHLQVAQLSCLHRDEKDGPSASTAYFSLLPGSLVHSTQKHTYVRFLKSKTTSKPTDCKGWWSSPASAQRGSAELGNPTHSGVYPGVYHGVQDTAAEKLIDLRAGAGTMALEQKANCNSCQLTKNKSFLSSSAFIGGWLTPLLDGRLRKGLAG